MAHHNAIRQAVRETLAGAKVNRNVGSRAWRVRHNPEDGSHSLVHHGTTMLSWDTDGLVLFAGLGIGSVSDQQGTNAALQALGSNLYYSRAGGADYRIIRS